MQYYILLTLTVLWFLFMTWLSHQDGEHTSKASMELAEHLTGVFKFLKTDRDVLNGRLRRLAHIFLFFGLTLLLGATLSAASKPLWPGIAAAVVWSWADERTKPFISGRHFGWFDVGLNLLGTAIGAAVLFCIYG